MSTAPPAASAPAVATPPSAEVELLQAKLRIAELEKEKLELELKVAKRVAVSDDDDDADTLFTGNLEKTNTTVVERLVLSDSESEDEGDPTVGDALPEALAFVLPDGPLNTVLSEELQERLVRRGRRYAGLSRKVSLRLPEALFRQVPAADKKDSSRLTATRKHAEKKVEGLLAALQHQARALAYFQRSLEMLQASIPSSSAMLEDNHMPGDLFGRGAAHLCAAVLLQTANVRDLVDNYRRQAIKSLGVEPLAVPEVLRELRLDRVGKKTLAFEMTEWDRVTSARAKANKSLQNLRTKVGTMLNKTGAGKPSGGGSGSGNGAKRQKFRTGGRGGGGPAPAKQQQQQKKN